MGAIFSIIIILSVFQDEPLAKWTLPIQISSLIATLTTVGKTAMLLAVSESISQLKWMHFYHKPAPLDRFQDFDDASRGPWGAATLLRTTNFKAILASLGAVITIFGLAIEPMAQQIIDFPVRNITSTTETATIGIADTYYSKAFQESGDSTGDADITGVIGTSSYLLSWQSSMINGLAGRVADVDMSCPLGATECRWPAFTTLGVCSSCKNITNYQRNCTDYKPTLICDYSSPEFPEFAYLRDDTPENLASMRTMFDPMVSAQTNRSQLYSSFVDLGRQTLASVKTQGPARLRANGTIPPPADVEMCTWDYCIRDYEPVMAIGRTLTQNKFVSEPVHFDRRANVTEADDTSTEYIYYRGNKTEREVKVSVNTEQYMWTYLLDPLNTTLIAQDSRNSNVDSERLDYGNYLVNGNMTKITSDLADTLTHEMRSAKLDGRAATLLKGEVRISEVYIDVRWGWLVLPLIETILATVLLLSSIVVSWRGPLWKGSALAPYLHPLRGWNEKDLDVDSYASAGAMQRLTTRMTAVLEQDASGALKMTRR